jgi:hypothetical protein
MKTYTTNGHGTELFETENGITRECAAIYNANGKEIAQKLNEWERANSRRVRKEAVKEMEVSKEDTGGIAEGVIISVEDFKEVLAGGIRVGIESHLKA